FWPVFGVGLVVSGITYYSWNFVIPGFIKQAEILTERDIGRLAAMQLQKHRTLSLSNYRLHADAATIVDPDPAAPDVHEIHLSGVAFLQLVHSTDVERYGTAREATITILQSRRQRPLVSAELRGVRTYTPEKGQYAEIERSVVEKEVPRTMRERLGFVDLPTLLDFEQAPHHMVDVAGPLGKLRRDVLAAVTYDTLATMLRESGGHCTLRGPDATADLSCAAETSRDQDGTLVLTRPSVKLIET